MREIKKRENKGFEIVCYHPKIYRQYAPNTGEISRILQTDDVKEVAAWFSRRAWGRVYEDDNIANPTVYFNGKRWPGEDEPKLGRCS